MSRRRSLVGWTAVSCSLLALTGCANRLAFGTATTFALDVSQRPDQTVEMTLGYDRMEIIAIPTYTAKDGERLAKDSTKDGDTYSVLGTSSAAARVPRARSARAHDEGVANA